MEKTFDFFEIPVIEIWTNRGDYPPGMLPQAVLPPYDDHTYSQYLERKEILEPLKLPGKTIFDTVYVFLRIQIGLNHYFGILLC